jgi:hypothetical protein
LLAETAVFCPDEKFYDLAVERTTNREKNNTLSGPVMKGAMRAEDV